MLKLQLGWPQTVSATGAVRIVVAYAELVTIITLSLLCTHVYKRCTLNAGLFSARQLGIVL